MTRQELLNKLHSIHIRVNITCLPSEAALECQYVTSKGLKEEWIGLNDWPVTVEKNSKGTTTYFLKIDGKELSFNDYQSFAECFEKNWIGEVHPWEDYDDDSLGEMLNWIEGFEEGC